MDLGWETGLDNFWLHFWNFRSLLPRNWRWRNSKHAMHSLILWRTLLKNKLFQDSDSVNVFSELDIFSSVSNSGSGFGGTGRSFGFGSDFDFDSDLRLFSGFLASLSSLELRCKLVGCWLVAVFDVFITPFSKTTGMITLSFNWLLNWNFDARA